LILPLDLLQVLPEGVQIFTELLDKLRAKYAA